MRFVRDAALTGERGRAMPASPARAGERHRSGKGHATGRRRLPRVTRGLCCIGTAFALAAAGSAAAQSGTQTVYVDWIQSSDRERVILNAYRMRGGEAADVSGLLIERRPERASHPRLYAESGPYYASDASRAFLTLLGSAADTTLARIAYRSGMYPERPHPRPLTLAEWGRLLDYLLQDSLVIGTGERRVQVRQVPQRLQNLASAEYQNALKASGPQPILPHLLRGLVLTSDGTRERVDFDTVRLGSAASRTVLVRNFGLRRARVTPSVRGGSGFSLRRAGPIVLAPGDSARIEVAFRPGGIGLTRAELHLGPDRSSLAPVRVSMVAAGASGGANWSWRVLAFAAIMGMVAAGLLLARRGIGPVLLRASRFRRRPRAKTGALDPAQDRLSRGAEAARDVARQLELLGSDLAHARSLWHEHQAFVERLERIFPEFTASEQTPREPQLLDYIERLETRRRVQWEQITQATKDRMAAQAESQRLRQLYDQARESLANSEATCERLAVECGALKQDLLKAEIMRDQTEARRIDLEEEREALTNERQRLADILNLGKDPPSSTLQQRIEELGPAVSPQFLWHFKQLLRDLEGIFRLVEDQAAGEREIGRTVASILGGENGNGGIVALRQRLERPEELQKLVKLAQIDELWTLSPERFYETVVVPHFIPILNNIARLHLYAGIQQPNLNVARWLAEEVGVEPRLLYRAYALIEMRLESDFGVQLRTVRLFEERFHRGEHQAASFAPIHRILPHASNAIGQLAPDTIYDLGSIGYSVNGVPRVQPSVSYVTPR